MSQTGMPPVDQLMYSQGCTKQRNPLAPCILIELDSIIRLFLPSLFTGKHIQPQFLLLCRILLRVKVSPTPSA
jgi:hypothetical protein